jgi:hypothetical protein
MERGHMLRLGAVHKTVTKANIVCSMLSEEVPALVLASGGDLTRVGTRVTNMPGAAVEPIIGHCTADFSVERTLQRRHYLAVEFSGEV